MRHLVIFALAATMFAYPATGQVVRDKESCQQAITDAEQGLAEAQIGARAHDEAADLIRIAKHLCTEANFVYVETLLEIARGMTVGE